MNSIKAKIQLLKLAVGAAPPRTIPPRCKEVSNKWKKIREKIHEAYNAGVNQVNGLTIGTLGNVWTFETWNEENGKPIPPEVFKFTVSNPYTPTNAYPPAAAAVQVAPQTGPVLENQAQTKQEKLLQCIKELRKCAMTRGYKDQRSGKYIRGKWDMLYSAEVCEAIELAKKGCEPYASAGGMRRPTWMQKRDFFKQKMRSLLAYYVEAVSSLGPECKPCVQTAAPAPAPAVIPRQSTITIPAPPAQTQPAGQ